MDYIDELKLYRGDDFVLPNGIKIKCPTLGEICDFGEKEYSAALSSLTSTAFDMCAYLDDIGIDFTQVSDYELFCRISPNISQSVTSIFFDDLDFTKFKVITENDEEILINSDGIKFSEFNYKLMFEYLRKVNNIPMPKYTKVANEFAKQQMIKDAKADAEHAKKKAKYCKQTSIYQPLISALINHPNFKFNYYEVWDLKVNVFFDCLKRVQIIENANHLYQGLYSGCIEYNKVKSDLNWLQTIK